MITDIYYIDRMTRVLKVQSPLSEAQVQATTEAVFEMGVFTVEADSQLDLDKNRNETWSKMTLKSTLN